MAALERKREKIKVCTKISTFLEKREMEQAAAVAPKTEPHSHAKGPSREHKQYGGHEPFPCCRYISHQMQTLSHSAYLKVS